MLKELKELWRFRELLWVMVDRELKIRYKNSVLGFFWSLLNPLATVLVLTLVFKYIMGITTPNFSAYVLAAYLPFMFFQFCLLDSAQSIIGAMPIIRKVYFPRELFPLASAIGNFIHLVLAMGVFLLYLLALWIVTGMQVSPFTKNVLFLPVLLIVNFALATGLSLAISALNTFYEDIKYMVSVALYLMFFLTPVMYFSEEVYYGLQKWFGDLGYTLYIVYHLNPVAMFSTAYRKVLVPPGPIAVRDVGMVDALPFSWPLFGIACLSSVVALIWGYAIFNKVKWRFVERR